MLCAPATTDRYVRVDAQRCAIGAIGIYSERAPCAAISPRDWPQYHAYIPAQKRDIINDIRTMFVEHIKHKFTLGDCKCLNNLQVIKIPQKSLYIIRKTQKQSASMSFATRRTTSG